MTELELLQQKHREEAARRRAKLKGAEEADTSFD